jgi:hypothetical protein
VTVTGDVVYQPGAHAALLQSAVVTGALVSIWTACDRGVSALPATSTEKNLTEAVAATVKGPAYWTAVGLVLGSLLSVV